MADLVQAVDDALNDRYPAAASALAPKTPASDQRGLRARMNRILKKHGGRTKDAAAAAGIPRSTWGHAMRGRKISPKTRDRIVDAFDRLITAPSRARAVRREGLPEVWSIGAVVVNQPGGSSYVNGRGAGVAPEDVADITTNPEWRFFNAEGLDSARIVDAWLSQGAAAATTALLDEIEDTYGSEFGFWGDHVDVAFEHRYGEE